MHESSTIEKEYIQLDICKQMQKIQIVRNEWCEKKPYKFADFLYTSWHTVLFA